MKSNSVSLEDELQTLDSKCKLLLRGEWITLVLSGVGTVVSAITNQAIFAATPLTFSLFLNILSREHRDRKVYHQSSQNLIELQRQYTSKMQALRSEFLGVDFSQADGEAFSPSKSFDELATKVKHLESFLEIQGGDYYSQGGAINQEVSILRNHQLEMAEAIETLTAQIEGGSSIVKSDGGEQSEILDHLDRLSAAVYELERKTSALSDVGVVTTDAPQPSVSEQVDIREKLEPIQSQMAALEERMNLIATADPAYDPDTLQSDMQSLINPIYDQLAALEKKVQSPSVSGTPADPMPQDQFDALSSSINDLKQRLDHSVSQVSADIEEVQSSLKSTYEQFDQVHIRMNTIQDSLEEQSHPLTPEDIRKQMDDVSSPLRSRLTGIQEQLGEINLLQAQIDQVRALAQQSSDSFNPDAIQSHVSAATAPLMEKIAAVDERFKAQSANQDFSVQLNQVIDPLQSHMVALEQRINQLAAEGDRTPLLSKMASLHGQLQLLEKRMASLPTQSVDHSSEIRQLTDKVSEMQTHLDGMSKSVSHDLAQMPLVIEKTVDDKADLLSELQSLSFEEAVTAEKKEAKSELDNLLDSLNF